MSHFIREGNVYRVFHNDSIDLEKVLPPENFIVKFDDFRNQFYLEEVESFSISGKLYGDVEKNSNRILDTFADRPNATGVILSGEKGSGKTLLIKKISIDGANIGYPTIIINSQFCGDIFNAFIQNIDQPAIILFDEFEKVYDKEGQEAILTLLDGVFPTKKLFMLTCNDKWQIDIHMRNRPGRIFYMLEFEGLQVEFIREYCEDNLINKDHIENVCKISSVFEPFNFDMLKALVEEMNRYNEPAQEAIRMLNVKPEYSSNGIFDIKAYKNGIDITEKISQDNRSFSGNPLKDQFWVYINNDAASDSDTEVLSSDEDEYFKLNPNLISDIDHKTMTYTYNKNGYVIKIIRQKSEKFDKYFYSAF
jgi:ATPase family associated with various cellular activities (AAA)